jgi:hypothetical protein
MNDLTLERYLNDPRLRAELEAAARRERARAVRRFLEQAAHALLGQRRTAPAEKLNHAACG